MKAKTKKLIAAFYFIYAAAGALHRASSARKWWVRPAWTRRKSEDAYKRLVKALRLEDTNYFKKFLRVTPEKKHLSLFVRKLPMGRKALSPGHRLAITLRFLTSGDSMVSIAFLFRIGISTTSMIIMEVCEGLWRALRKSCLPKPTEEMWNKIAKGYYDKWNFPHCIGSVDGKHVKKDFSIILMAFVDHDYKVIVVAVGAYGSNSDGGVRKNSKFGDAFDFGRIAIPQPCTTSNFHKPLPFVLVGDEGFQLQKNFLRPFPGVALTNARRIFNYRLSRARKCAENAFGIISSRWRILRRPITLKVDTVDQVVMACIVLHNFLMERADNCDSAYCPNGLADQVLPNGEIIEGQWRQDVTLPRITRTAVRNFSLSAESVRNDFVAFFNTVGAVSWQADLAQVN